MSDIYFSNYRLEKNTHYFLYIGSIKNYGLNIFLKEALSKIHNRKFDFISIIQDILAQYVYPNMIVVNPMVDEFNREHGGNGSCRVPTRVFLSSVSNNRHVQELVQKLLDRQKKLYIYMYESLPEMNFDQLPGVSIIGPDSKISERLNSKIFQYKACKHFMPMPDFRFCNGLDELLKTTDTLWSDWTEGIFVSEEYSAGGLKSMVAHDPDDIIGKFKDEKLNYLVSRFIPHEYDPTVLAVVAGEEDIYIAGVADQRIEQGTRFTGSDFPSVLNKKIIEKLKEYTRVVGQWLVREGYRGIFGCDFLVDDNDDIYFLEINARKQGTTLEFCCTLEQSLPPGSPMLPELEFYAVNKGVFPPNTMEMKSNPKNLYWGTYNYKIHDSVQTTAYIPQSAQEREAFKKVAERKLRKDFLILEHAGCDFVIAEGAFIARIVALGHNPADVQQGLNQGRKTIDLTIIKKLDSEDSNE